MGRIALTTAIAAMVTAMSVIAAEEPAPKAVSASVTQLQVVRKGAEDLDVTLFSSQGTKFAITLVQPDRAIVGVDEDASRIASATDDKGTDFIEDGDDKWLSGFFSKISKNRHKVAIPVSFKTLPALGATSIRLKAEVVLLCGSEEKTQELKSIDLAAGATLQCGEHSVKLAPREGNTEKDAKKRSISAEMDDQGHWLKSIEFLDEKGLIIKSSANGSMGGKNLTRWIDVQSGSAKVGVRVTYYTKVERVPCPIDLNFGVGLQ